MMSVTRTGVCIECIKEHVGLTHWDDDHSSRSQLAFENKKVTGDQSTFRYQSNRS
uniref:Uncharacterized protein n=1 Tax=Oryza sativa subsp. japonica TaxID=39947 RepID=Q6Z7G8_ORYSJ|nr:hypothetical protein [Oryza sativa Japonica Group]